MAIAYQDTHDDRADLVGISASYTTGPWRFATKVEQLQSNSTIVLLIDGSLTTLQMASVIIKNIIPYNLTKGGDSFVVH